MHNTFKIYYFIDEFNRQEIQKLNINIALIYRNYAKNNNSKLIKKIKDFCFKQKREFYLSNNIKLALKLDLDGVYIPSFNQLCCYKNIRSKKNFKILGSAHNLSQLKNKENQGCESIFIAPLFKTKKNNYFLDIVRFNLISNNSKNKIIALGGINKYNYKKLKLTKSNGLASISWIKKNRPKNLGRFLNNLKY